MQTVATETETLPVPLATVRASMSAHPLAATVPTSRALATVAAVPYAQQLADAGLGWTVSKGPLYGPDGRVWPGAYGIRRNDTEAPLGTVGSRYVPLQNAQVAEALERMFAHLPGSMRPRLENAGALGGGSGNGAAGERHDVGARVFAQLAMPAELSALLRVPQDGESETSAFLTLTNRHDGGGSAVIGGSVVRIVCRNTFAMASREARAAGGLALRHTINRTSSAAYREHVSKWLKSLGAAYAAEGERLRSYAARPMRSVDVVAAVTEILHGEVLAPEEQTRAQRAAVDAVIEMIEGRDGQFVPTGDVTAYSLLQSVTAYEMHRRPARGALEAQTDTRLWRVLSDDSDTITRAFGTLDAVLAKPAR
jgi:hypothetical protein